ncbi:hypothetical protein BVRB_3g062840 [Beta vulgaris subsp. vulgaris]|nr:hypothetical protein BVRB_3g062840 [Beta vulgaris subsp. vulgaris]
MWMLVIFMFLVVLPQILPPTLPPPPSLLLFVPVIIMVILLHFALFTSSEVPITTDVICWAHVLQLGAGVHII